jgi:transposase
MWRSVTEVGDRPAYLQAVREALPHATVVVDKFHAVRLAGAALDAVRGRLQSHVGRRQSRGGRSPGPPRWSPALSGSRRILLKARERLAERDRNRLDEAFGADATGELRTAWELKERFRDWYLAPDQDAARAGLQGWYEAVETAGIGEFTEQAHGPCLGAVAPGALRLGSHERGH